MQVGINLLLWTANPDQSHARLIKDLASIGYDLIELPMFAPDSFPAIELQRMLSDNGLAVSGCGVLPEDCSLIAADKARGQRATEYMLRTIDHCATLKAAVLCGPLFNPVGEFTGVAPTRDERQHFIERMRPIADHAAQAGVKLAVEPLNRFETHFINTLADGYSLVRELGHPSVGLLSDTFHQHIEERNSAAALAAAADMVFHAHASENDRGCPGRGQVRWKEWASTLHQQGYTGSVVIESFSAGLPELAAATRVWRDLTGDLMQLATEGHQFIRSTLG